MATNDRRLKVTELDFDDIKNNLKTFLKTQDQFKDYDFEGSGLNILLDTLAYNTHYLAFNANMLANEMFLDSASLRSSVVSLAKSLGYETTSARASTATINVALTTTSTTATMPAGTAFTSTVDGVNYQFVTVSDITASNTGNLITFANTPVYEGTYLTTRYTVNSDDVDQRFLLTDSRADTSTLTVKVQTSASDSTTTTYTKATDITELSSTSSVYYLQETDSGLYEIYFGDGVVSKSVVDGNIVTLQYVVTNKTLGNGAVTFTPPSSIDGVTTINVTTISSAIGGAEPETISSIKLNAPLDYASQSRAVNINDYKVFVRKLFANTQAVSVWGGEDGSYDFNTNSASSNPEFGKVFISVKTTTGQNLTSAQKLKLENDLKPFKVASITPVVVDPNTTFLILTVNFNYNTNSTTRSADDLKSLVTTTISDYNTSDLLTFGAPFRQSKLTGLIDDTDTSILNSSVVVSMGQKFTPITTSANSYVINFGNALFNPHTGHTSIIASTGFNINNDTTSEYFFDDDGRGNLRIVTGYGDTDTVFSATAGTVDYTTGIVSINSISITGVSNVDGSASTQIRITATPNSYDIVPVRNQILEIDTSNTLVTANVDSASSSGTAFSNTTTGSTATTTVTTPSTTPPTSAY